MARTELALPELYTEDETAWLEAMAELIGAGDWTERSLSGPEEGMVRSVIDGCGDGKVGRSLKDPDGGGERSLSGEDAGPRGS